MPLQEYSVGWFINLDADSPEQAAERARALQSPGTSSLSFAVALANKEDTEQHQVNLLTDTIYTPPELIAKIATHRKPQDTSSQKEHDAASQALRDMANVLANITNTTAEQLLNLIAFDQNWTKYTDKERVIILTERIAKDITERALDLTMVQ